MFPDGWSAQCSQPGKRQLPLRIIEPTPQRPVPRLFNNMRVYIPATGLYTYPDLAIVCDKPRFIDGEFDTLLNPLVIGEVVSPSTEVYDRTEKFEHYQTIPSLKEYLLLSSERMHADLFTRGSDGKWVLCTASHPEEVNRVASIPCRLVLKDLYEKVEFGERSGTRPVIK